MPRATTAGAVREGHARGRALSPAEFSTMLERAKGALWLIAAGVLGRRNDADDVLQDAAMIGLAKISDFEPGSSFNAWMGGIVRNVARNYARKTARRQTAPTDPVAIDQQTAGRGPEPDRFIPARGQSLRETEQFDDDVLCALQSLDETARACLLLRTIHEMPYKEIALWLDIPEGTAMSHVHRARHSLRRQLASAEPQGGPR